MRAKAILAVKDFILRVLFRRIDFEYLKTEDCVSKRMRFLLDINHFYRAIVPFYILFPPALLRSTGPSKHSLLWNPWNG